MNISPRTYVRRLRPLGLAGRGFIPNRYDLTIFAALFGMFVALAHGTHEMNAPLARLDIAPITLDPRNLPDYALRTTLRMFVAILASLLFTFIVAPLAAKSRRAGIVIVPALDILQSIPVLGFLTFTVTFFMHLVPGSQLGAEGAAIFAIFTSQAWNMAFSFYQSLRTIPADLDEVCRHFRFSSWLRFWRLEVPFAMPGLVWNTMLSMSGSWFFVVASEAITVGDTTIKLPGIGSWLALAIERRDIAAVILAVLTMGLVILAYDQLVFRPIVAWADKFRSEQTSVQQRPQSLIYDVVRRTRLVMRLAAPFAWIARRVLTMRLPESATRIMRPAPESVRRLGDGIWYALVIAGTVYGLWLIVNYVRSTLSPADIVEAFKLGFYTLARVIILIALASLVWVPVGVWIGLRPKMAQRVQPLAQFLAAFPANVLFPVFVVGIVRFRLDPNIWLSPLMILGTQWYILFNVIAGASAFPGDLREAAALYRLRSRQWWFKVILPGIFPYFITGALTATGAAWNTSIVAEVASWGAVKLEASGLGAYIANATDAADYPRVTLGIAVMSLFVVTFNRMIWRPLYNYAERHLRLD